MARFLFVLVLAALFTDSFQQASRIRLVGGSGQHEGRVEVRRYTSSSYPWGTVCGDLFDMSDARVVCRMLGYSEASAVRGSAYYGQGSGSIHMDDLRCTGTESSLFDCSYRGWGRHDCSHRDDVGVVCRSSSNHQSSDHGCPTVRISGSTSYQSDRMTTYTMTRQLFNDRPVYKSSPSEDFLYYHNQETDGWHVGSGLGSDIKAMYLPNDTSLYADGTSGTWFLLDGANFRPSSHVRVSCEDPNAIVNGQWSNWGSWSTCHSYCKCGDETCDANTVHRTRRCITPPPRKGGSDCAGDASQVQLCPCLDIDECLDDALNSCDLESGASCVNTPGGFYCECADGFNIQADERTCRDFDECANGDVCENGRCANTPGSYNCTCYSGYGKNPTTQKCEFEEFEGLSTGAIVGISFGVIITSVLLIVGFYYCKVCKRDGSLITVVPVPSNSPPAYARKP